MCLRALGLEEGRRQPGTGQKQEVGLFSLSWLGSGARVTTKQTSDHLSIAGPKIVPIQLRNVASASATHPPPRGSTPPPTSRLWQREGWAELPRREGCFPCSSPSLPPSASPHSQCPWHTSVHPLFLPLPEHPMGISLSQPPASLLSQPSVCPSPHLSPLLRIGGV